MAGTTSAHVKHLSHQTHNKAAQLVNKVSHISSAKKGKIARGNKTASRNKIVGNNKIVAEAIRYEQFSKYWSILSNVAAIIAVGGAIYSLLPKKRFW